MSDSESYTSPADIFLQEEVYRLGTSPGLRSLPPGPLRDFILLSWGPIVYRTCYKRENKHLLPVFLRCLNDAVSKSLGQTLIGSEKDHEELIKSYSSKIFSARDSYNDLDEEGVRRAFHDYKVSLIIPATDLPSRLRACLMVDDEILSNLQASLDLCVVMKKSVDLDRCWAKVIEENFPDSRCGEQPYLAHPSEDGSSGAPDGKYQGWAMVALPALVEVFDGIRKMKHLVEYYREGRVYLGQGKWSNRKPS
ncbi:hypothetical protein N7454_007458 [Penicillium verhagenii]|nr:hypothetical protein N7454_007458 [Penicillium verhagenii]